MKKIIKPFKILFHHIGSFFDRLLITPITKFMLKIADIFKGNGKAIERIFNKKSTLIVVSLILAFGVFVLIDRESNIMIDQYAEILYKQPVSAIYNEESYVVEGLPKTVDITLVGQKRHIFLAKQAPSKGVSVDLTGLKPGNHKVTLKYSQRLKSLDYKLDPSTVTVTIYEKVSDTKSLTIDVLHKDNLNSKLYIENIELDRSDVIVKGAQYKLEKVATVKALVDVDSFVNPKAGTMTLKNVPLVAYDTDGKIVDVEIVPKSVGAKVTITSPKKEVPIKIVPKGDLAFGKAISSINTNVSTVTVYGEQASVDKLTELKVEIDVKDLDKNKDFNITLKRPNGITELSEKTITVKVSIDNSTTKEFRNVHIVTEGLNSNYAVQALSEADSIVTVVVKGSENAIKALDETTLKAYIDLKSYGVGEHEIPVKVVGDDLTLDYSSKTKKVRVRIIEK